VPLDEVVEFLENKPKGLEVVLTGRNPDEKLVELADYVSEIKAVKHPYEKGINSRIGIEK
jgi:cob(I)alamin adenosyltransferase